MNKNKFTAKQFNELFPDDDACLVYMFAQAYGDMEACHNCGVIEPKYYRIRNKQRRLHPLEQKQIADVFLEHGIKTKINFDEYIEDYDW
jgi:hypothetical protein